MRIAALCHTEMAEELAVLRATASSTAEFTLGRSHNEAFQVEIVDEVVAEFRRQVEWRSCLKMLGVRVCDLILRPPSSRAQLANRLE
jgi:hypothetical protein